MRLNLNIVACNVPIPRQKGDIFQEWIKKRKRGFMITEGVTVNVSLVLTQAENGEKV